MKRTTLLILVVLATCQYCAGETMLEKGKEAVNSGVETVREKAEALKDAVKEKIVAMKETVVGKAETAKETMTEGAESVKETLQDKADTAKETLKDKAESTKETIKEGAESAKEAVKDKAETAKEVVKEKSEEVKETVKDKMYDWSDKAQELWEKSGTSLSEASMYVKDGLNEITPEFLQMETDPKSKLYEWKNKISQQTIKELQDAAVLLDEANAQLKGLMSSGKVDAKSKMTRLRLAVDHAVRHSTRAFQSLRRQANREGIPATLAAKLKQGWDATTNAVDSLKDFVSNAYNKEEDRHEIVQDLDATFKAWKAAASEKLEAMKDAVKKEEF